MISGSRLIREKDKTYQTRQCHVGQLALNKWTFVLQYKLNSHNEWVLQKSRRVKFMGLLQHSRC